MMCEHCKQRSATVTLTTVQGGQTIMKQYCEVCASKLHPFQEDSQDDPISLQQLVSNLFGTSNAAKGVPAKEKKATQQQCSTCGFTYRQFLKEGKFGCADCYGTFREQLPPVFSRLQAGLAHKGKSVIQSFQQLQQRIDNLRLEMKEAVQEERFEDAAKFRDSIKVIQRKLDVGGVSE